MESQTTDITLFAVAFHYDGTIKALETLWNTAYDLWRQNENNDIVCEVHSLAFKIKVLNDRFPGYWKWTIAIYLFQIP